MQSMPLGCPAQLATGKAQAERIGAVAVRVKLLAATLGAPRDLFHSTVRGKSHTAHILAILMKQPASILFKPWRSHGSPLIRSIHNTVRLRGI